MLSVIVPVYNAETSIRRCIDSILLQSYSDFELLLIDDGSIDDSGHICDEYAEIESYIKKYNKYEDYRYLITRMKYNCYKWNYNRLSRELKKMFLKKMSQEYRRHYMDGDFEKKRFSIQEYKKILMILQKVL